MVMVDVVCKPAYMRAYGSSRSAWSKGRQSSDAVLHSPCEPGELSQWLSHDNSTINIVLVLSCLWLSFNDAGCGGRWTDIVHCTVLLHNRRRQPVTGGVGELPGGEAALDGRVAVGDQSSQTSRRQRRVVHRPLSKSQVQQSVVVPNTLALLLIWCEEHCTKQEL